jgi:CMP-N-acetylneuraminic acid synthetase
MGSKGVPGKNLRRLGGLSLTAYKAISARRCHSCTRLIISTESSQLQQEAARYGAEVLFTRPEELASDTASSAEVVAHTIEWFETHTDDRYDAIMLLEPSSPFGRPCDYDNAVDLMLRRRAQCVVGMRETEVNSVFVGPLSEDGRITAIVDQMRRLRGQRRQDLPQEYTMNGALYLFRWEYFKRYQNWYADRDGVFGYVMDPAYSLEIDSLQDWAEAEYLVKSGKIDLSHWEDPELLPNKAA